MIAEGGRRAELYAGLRAIADEFGDDIRSRFPDIPRRVSGYGLDSLLPEHGFDVGKALVGSESTLVTVLHAEIDLVPVPAAKTLLVLGFPSITDAADAAPTIAPLDPTMIEGMDDLLVGNGEAEGQESRGIEAAAGGARVADRGTPRCERRRGRREGAAAAGHARRTRPRAAGRAVRRRGAAAEDRRDPRGGDSERRPRSARPGSLARMGGRRCAQKQSQS